VGYELRGMDYILLVIGQGTDAGDFEKGQQFSKEASFVLVNVLVNGCRQVEPSDSKYRKWRGVY
jgi:hypothetical protein